MQRALRNTLALAALLAPTLAAGQSPAVKQDGPAIWLLDTTQILVEHGCADAVVAVRPVASAATGGGPGRQTLDAPATATAYVEGVRPPQDVCRRTFLDELGTARAETVRETLKARYRESQMGVAPGTQTLRLAARGTPCEEPRIDAVWYDFDAGGLLRRVTYVWRRQGSPDVYTYMSGQIGRFATVPPRVTGAGRTEGATDIYRYLIEDRPQQQAVAITYTPLTP